MLQWKRRTNNGPESRRKYLNSTALVGFEINKHCTFYLGVYLYYTILSKEHDSKYSARIVNVESHTIVVTIETGRELRRRGPCEVACVVCGVGVGVGVGYCRHCIIQQTLFGAGGLSEE